MYDLVYDPGERKNLAEDAEYGQVLANMRQRLKEYEEKTEDPIREGLMAVKPGWKVNRKECQKASSQYPEDYM